MAKINKEELDYMAYDDARVLAQYHEILADSARLGRAKKEANKQLKAMNDKAKNLKQVKNIKSSNLKGGSNGKK